MALKDWFKSDAERLGRTVPSLLASVSPTAAPTVSHDSARSQRLMERLPRGADVIRDQIDRKERARWARSNEIAAMCYRPGDVLLGKHQGFLIGDGSDKPSVMVAGARSGKTATVLMPTLLTYPGSIVVLDPKGELARETAAHRRDVLGQRTYICDPFGTSGQAASPHNPLAEIDLASNTVVDDVDVIAQTLILKEGGDDGSHWTNSAQAYLRGLLLHTLTLPEAERTLTTTRQLMMLTYPPLVAAQAALAAQGAKDPAEAAQHTLFMEMAARTELFGGALAGAGTSFLKKNPKERSSIVSTAETQCRWIDSEPMQGALQSSCFSLASLAEHPTTIYLCLPSGMMESHFRWLRLIIRLAIMRLERRGTWPRGKTPILFMIEEFATLGHMPIMEQAASYLPGFGVKLICVLQDLGQLQRHYKASWQTFLGNAGVIQCFGNADAVTLDYISNRLGSLSFVRGHFGATGDADKGDKSRDYIDKERLLYPHEIAEAFARGTGGQLLLVDGQPPMAIERLTFDDVAQLRQSVMQMPVS